MSWLIVFAISLVVEFAVPGLVSIWFALGALVAFAAAMCHANIAVQITLFFLVSFVAVAFTRPLAKKLQGKKNPTNADRMIGETAIVTERIDPIDSHGQVKVLGQIWSAVSQDRTPIESDTLVEVIAIQGVKLIVKQK